MLRGCGVSWCCLRMCGRRGMLHRSGVLRSSMLRSSMLHRSGVLRSSVLYWCGRVLHRSRVLRSSMLHRSGSMLHRSGMRGCRMLYRCRSMLHRSRVRGCSVRGCSGSMIGRRRMLRTKWTCNCRGRRRYASVVGVVAVDRIVLRVGGMLRLRRGHAGAPLRIGLLLRGTCAR